nr:hypothetical protein [Tanacetum cinerariifolium]
KTQFVNEIDRLSREYYDADHMNAVLGVYTELDEVTNLQCYYLEFLIAKIMNVKFVSAMCAKCVMIEKHDLCVPKSAAKPIKKTVASESNKKPRNNVRKLHEHFGKIYKWSYIKFTPSGYIWKPKSKQGNVNPNVSMPLGNASRTANVKDTMTSRRSIM